MFIKKTKTVITIALIIINVSTTFLVSATDIAQIDQINYNRFLHDQAAAAKRRSIGQIVRDNKVLVIGTAFVLGVSGAFVAYDKWIKTPKKQEENGASLASKKRLLFDTEEGLRKLPSSYRKVLLEKISDQTISEEQFRTACATQIAAWQRSAWQKMDPNFKKSIIAAQEAFLADDVKILLSQDKANLQEERDVLQKKMAIDASKAAQDADAFVARLKGLVQKTKEAITIVNYLKNGKGIDGNAQSEGIDKAPSYKSLVGDKIAQLDAQTTLQALNALIKEIDEGITTARKELTPRKSPETEINALKEVTADTNLEGLLAGDMQSIKVQVQEVVDAFATDQEGAVHKAVALLETLQKPATDQGSLANLKERTAAAHAKATKLTKALYPDGKSFGDNVTLHEDYGTKIIPKIERLNAVTSIQVLENLIQEILKLLEEMTKPVVIEVAPEKKSEQAKKEPAPTQPAGEALAISDLLHGLSSSEITKPEPTEPADVEALQNSEIKEYLEGLRKKEARTVVDELAEVLRDPSIPRKFYTPKITPQKIIEHLGKLDEEVEGLKTKEQIAEEAIEQAKAKAVKILENLKLALIRRKQRSKLVSAEHEPESDTESEEESEGDTQPEEESESDTESSSDGSAEASEATKEQGSGTGEIGEESAEFSVELSPEGCTKAGEVPAGEKQQGPGTVETEKEFAKTSTEPLSEDSKVPNQQGVQ